MKRDRKEQYKQYQIANKEMIAKRKHDYRVANKEKLQEYERGQTVKFKVKDFYRHIMKKYGCSEEQYNEMFNKQSGHCAICNTHQSELKKALCVDHDHTTGRIRGLLCGPCNLMIGNANDNINILMNGVKYLKT